MLPNIHLLGIQGSGKGTQSALLVEKYHLNYISSGDLFRKRSRTPDAFGQSLTQELSTGKLLPTPFLLHTVEDYLDSNSIKEGLLGDGIIRTTEQQARLAEIWEKYQLEQPILINLILSEGVAKQRIEVRKQKQNNPELYQFHLTYGGKLLKRNDDNPRAIEERFALFHSMTEPVIKIFDNQQRCFHIDAERSIEEIHADICAALTAVYPNLGHVTD